MSARRSRTNVSSGSHPRGALSHHVNRLLAEKLPTDSSYDVPSAPNPASAGITGMLTCANASSREVASDSGSTTRSASMVGTSEPLTPQPRHRHLQLRRIVLLSPDQHVRDRRCSVVTNGASQLIREAIGERRMLDHMRIDDVPRLVLAPRAQPRKRPRLQFPPLLFELSIHPEDVGCLVRGANDGLDPAHRFLQIGRFVDLPATARAVALHAPGCTT